MTQAIQAIQKPANDPVLEYLPGSAERNELVDELARQSGEQVEIPLVIGGREVRTGNTQTAIVPHRHRHVLATVHLAGEAEVVAAVAAASAAKAEWSAMPFEDRAAIFLRAADLLAGPWRMRVNAATMLNQSKTCHQADIDAACEMVDFLRFNCRYAQDLAEQMQPPISPEGFHNSMELRPLEGFVFAISPFNFTSIGANLAHAPALMGNTTIWKPSPSSLFSNYQMMQLFEEAGLPPGVINFLPGDAESMSRQLLANKALAGVHFTGSTAVFRSIWRQIADNLPNLRDYPRIVGETGGKDFIVAHASADPAHVMTAMIRGAYEFQGQKCSAASRAYIPRSMWKQIRDELAATVASIPMGDPADFTNFMGAVIHQGSLDKCRRYIEAAKSAPDAEIIAGGGVDDTEGYFVAPTLIEAGRGDYASMCEEIFGPVLTVFAYDDDAFEDTLDLCDRTSEYALTGAILAEDEDAVDLALERLRYAAGNFYINDKPTGAVVGQQPFGGSRASGTNDKAGSPLNLLRWTSPRTIKRTMNPPTEYRYGFMG